MSAENKIKRHGYHLMSLASLGMFCVTLWGVIMLSAPWHASAESTGFLGMTHGMDANARNQWMLASACWTLAYLLPLLALRRLGNRLYRQEALTLPVAHAFLSLANALLVSVFVRLLADSLATEAGSQPGTFSLPFGSFYIVMITCLCLYSVAHLMRLAAEAADDARSIV
ncbi:MAG: hypothetical protein QM612_02365 [Thermomonas sp.]|uniref:hypothetical protein n=1 Tax=Thermomonas sp. TaxID=1971895 RepID=UPI0039E4C4DE